MFFESAWADSVKYEIDEYADTMLQLTNNEQGLILCPDCVTTKITSLSMHSELM